MTLQFRTETEWISTYFEEHDVVSSCDVHIIPVFAFCYIVPHVITNVPQVVGTKNYAGRIPAWSIIENLRELWRWYLIKHCRGRNITHLSSQCAAVITKYSLTRNPPHTWSLLLCTEAIYSIDFCLLFLPFMIPTPSTEKQRGNV